MFDRTDAGTHAVADLERWDWIDLNGFGYAGTAQALARFAQAGDDVVFADQGVRIVFADIQRAQITADMILL